MGPFGFIDEGAAGGTGPGAGAAAAAAATAAAGAAAAAGALAPMVPPAGTDWGKFVGGFLNDVGPGSQLWGMLNPSDPVVSWPQDDYRNWRAEGTYTPGQMLLLDMRDSESLRIGPYNCSNVAGVNKSGFLQLTGTDPTLTITALPDAAQRPCGPAQRGLSVKFGTQTGNFYTAEPEGDYSSRITKHPRVKLVNLDGSPGTTAFVNPDIAPPAPVPKRERPMLPPPVFPDPPVPAPEPARVPQQPPDRRPLPPIAPPVTPDETEPPPAQVPETPPMQPQNPTPRPPGPVVTPNRPGTGTGTGTGTGPGTGTVPQPGPLIIPQRPILPDGNLAPEPEPAPEQTPEGNTYIGTLVIPAQGPAPQPTLEGIATEVGKIERKLEIQLLQDQGPGPDLEGLQAAVDELLALLTADQPDGRYTITGPCEVSGGQAQASVRVADWPPTGDPLSLLSVKLDALAEIMQYAKELRQPICHVRATGQELTVDFVEDRAGTWEDRPLRKTLSYRDQGGGSLESHTAGWTGFSWQAGPVQLISQGKWGKVQVYAASRGEAERVIRHAAGLAGYDIDGDSKHQWIEGSHAGGRIGRSGTMIVKPVPGGVAVRWRDGPTGPSFTAVTNPRT